MKKTLLTLTLLFSTIAFLSSQNILVENFESGALPSGWTKTQSSPSVGWEFGTATVVSSQYWTIPAHTKIAGSNDDKYDNQAATANVANLDFLITPSMDFSGYAAIFMEFAAFFDGQYGSTAHIKVSTNNGATWTNVKTLTANSAWQNVTVNLTAFNSNTDVKVAIHHNDNNGWASGFAVDDIRIFVPNSFDMAGVKINLDDHVLNIAQTIAGSLNNAGSVSVTSLDLNYNINNGAVVTQALSSLSIAPLANYNFSHGTQWTPSSTGNHTIKVWASNINGNVDGFTTNDTVIKTVYVANNLSQRKVLYEQFTSNTCGPCASSAPAITTFLNNNNVNSTNGKIVALKNHMNYPSPGNDASYTTEASTRHTYYGVTGIPHANIGGSAYSGHPGNTASTQVIVNAEYARPAIFNIDINAEYTADSVVTVSGNYTSHVDVAGNLKLHVVIIEDLILKSQMNGTGTTSQTEFRQVMRKMLPNAAGTTVPTQTEGQNTPFTLTYDLKNGPKVFNTMNGLTVVTFIQNVTTKEVYQANSVRVNLFVGIEEAKSTVFGVNVYPNPVSNNANLVFNLNSAENTQVMVYNMIGELVYSNELGVLGQGNHSVEINTTSFNSGLYFVNLKSGNTVTTKKISVLH